MGHKQSIHHLVYWASARRALLAFVACLTIVVSAQPALGETGTKVPEKAIDKEPEIAFPSKEDTRISNLLHASIYATVLKKIGWASKEEGGSALDELGLAGQVSYGPPQRLGLNEEQAAEILSRFDFSKYMGFANAKSLEIEHQGGLFSIEGIERPEWEEFIKDVAELIVTSTFWSEGMYPEVTFVTDVKKAMGQVLSKVSYNLLLNDSDVFSAAYVAHDRGLPWTKNAEISIKPSRLLKIDKTLGADFTKAKKNFSDKGNRISYLVKEKEVTRTCTNGYTLGSGSECVVKYGQTPRQSLRVLLHELTHSYLRTNMVRNSDKEEGICEYVAWWSMVRMFGMDERIASKGVSKVKEYREPFEYFKDKFGSEISLDEAIRSYIDEL